MNFHQEGHEVHKGTQIEFPFLPLVSVVVIGF